MSNRKKTPGVRVINPKASTVPLTSPSPFSETPFTTSPGLPVQPLTTPKLRQLVESENVRIINPKGL